MKKSESLAYLNYGACKAKGRHEEALQNYITYISDCSEQFDSVEIRLDALQKLGELYYGVGNRELANLLFKVVFDCQPSSMSIKLEYARFLFRQAEEPVTAMSVCNEILHAPVVDNISNKEHARLQRICFFAQELKKEIMRSSPET